MLICGTLIVFALIGGVLTEDPKVLILGAGTAGITVAKTLEDAGHHHFLLIEGASKIGGRIRSEQLSGSTVEMGSMWVYAAGTNPIYKLLKDNGIAMSVDYPGGLTLRDNTGNDITDTMDEPESRLYDAIDAYDVEGKNATAKDLPDFTVASSLRYHNWLPKTVVEEAIQGMLAEWEFTVPPDYLSGKHAYWWAPYEQFDSDDTPIITDPRGYEELLKTLGANFTDDTNKIKLNEVVTEIKQGSGGVEVTTSSGSKYSGDFAVTTFSLGVLQSGDVTYDPEFPDCKKRAISGFGMGYLTQIYLKFPKVFWDNTTYILYASEQRGRYSIYVNMDIVLPGSMILQLSVWGDESRRVERLDDQEVVDDILRHLRLMYPNEEIPTPTNYAISKWTYDPLTRGAYSYWPTGFTRENMADMMASYGRVYFAGEHLDPVQYKYGHAAYTSGKKTASDILECIKDKDSCKTSTDGFECSKTYSPKGDDCVVSKASISVRVQGWLMFVVVLVALLLKTHST